MVVRGTEVLCIQPAGRQIPGPGAEIRRRAEETIVAIIHDVRDRLPPGISPDHLAREVCDEAIGLGPLESLLADPEVIFL